MTDPINHPEHYTQSDIECIDAIKAALTPEEFRGYCKGNILKYTWRERIKGQDESIAKAVWYANKMLETGDEQPKSRSETISDTDPYDVIHEPQKPATERSEASEDKPDWKDAPEWAMWLAQDVGGDWFWYDLEPIGSAGYWNAPGEYELIYTSNPVYNPDWHNTLEARP